MSPHISPRSEELRRRFAEEARAERPDLSQLCLLVAAEADGSLDEAGMDAVQMDLDRLAGQVPFRPGGPLAWATALAELLGSRCGFRGTPGDYERLESSLLHEVVRRRRGLPILLSVVWMEVARRAGAPVYGVALPGHFVVGFGPAQDQVLADPFDGGRVLTGADAELLVTGATGAPLNAAMLQPADPLDVVLRILNNIRAWAAVRPERSDVALWAVELSLLLPAHPARLRYERAQLLVRSGDFLAGAAELEAYADVVGAVDAPAAETVRTQARAARAMLN
jgi:regulator of sirC expression with transglutaminase-like and TPR domain